MFCVCFVRVSDNIWCIVMVVYYSEEKRFRHVVIVHENVSIMLEIIEIDKEHEKLLK